MKNTPLKYPLHREGHFVTLKQVITELAYSVRSFVVSLHNT